jgi:hypothetical protein
MSWFDNANNGADLGDWNSPVARANGQGGASWMDGLAGMWGGTGQGLGNAISGAVDTGMGIWGGVQNVQNSAQVNDQVQNGLAQNNAATQAQIDALTGQIDTNRQQAQDMYQRSLADVTGQNQGLEGNIATQTNSLNALSDPNSAYMQMARQAIERKDAAAGRRSQWGERETQLAGTLADYVGKYSPGIQQSITGARNQINQNNQGLASLYSQANQPADRNTLAQIQLLQQQIANANAANTTGRDSQAAANNAQRGVVQQGIQGAGSLISGLSGLFGGGGGQNINGILNGWGSNSGLGTGGWATQGSNLYGSSDGGWGFGDQGLGTGMGYTGGGLGGGYMDLAGSGSLGGGMDFQSGGLGQGLQGYGTNYGGLGSNSFGGDLFSNDTWE